MTAGKGIPPKPGPGVGVTAGRGITPVPGPGGATVGKGLPPVPGPPVPVVGPGVMGGVGVGRGSSSVISRVAPVTGRPPGALPLDAAPVSRNPFVGGGHGVVVGGDGDHIGASRAPGGDGPGRGPTGCNPPPLPDLPAPRSRQWWWYGWIPRSAMRLMTAAPPFSAMDCGDSSSVTAGVSSSAMMSAAPVTDSRAA